MNLFSRRAATFTNQMRSSCGALLGIVQGVLSDGELSDAEITFLRDWLVNHEAVSLTWPGDVIYSQIAEALQDGVITSDERSHLVSVLQKLVGGQLHELASSTHVTELPLSGVGGVDFLDKRFCLSGDFVFGPRAVCEAAIARRGGVVQPGITKKLSYLVIGGLGSTEWKHGSFGTKIEKAMGYVRDGIPIAIVHEDVWASSLTDSRAI